MSAAARIVRVFCALSAIVVVACGGRVLGETTGGEPPVFVDAGVAILDAAAPVVDASPPADASPVDALACDAAPFSFDRDAAGWTFYRQQDVVDFFRNLAVMADLVVPAHGVDCSTFAACTYDPLDPRLDAADVHYADRYGRFVGPDGKAWAVFLVPSRETWVAANQTDDPCTYAEIVAANEGCIAGGPCATGDE